MAKEIKNVKLTLVPDATGTTYDKAIMQYCVASTTEADLQAYKEVTITLTGADLTDAQSLFAAALAEAQSQEGIV